MADTGTGIAPDQIEAIFEPFFTTKEVGKGTGLGLSQAFGFAKQSGGDIEVTSAPGQGATFTIYLPQAAMPADATEVAAAASEPAIRGRGYRVLVVEDNDDVGHFSTELLEDLGYTVRRVANADAALAILAEDEFSADLVFSDVIMPGMNGVELAGIIRERYPGLPVVLDQRLQQRAGGKRPSRLRTDSKALFGGVAVANSPESDFGAQLGSVGTVRFFRAKRLRSA